MNIRENSNDKFTFFDTAKSYSEAKLLFFEAQSIKTGIMEIAHSNYMTPKFLEFLITSDLPCFQHKRPET